MVGSLVRTCLLFSWSHLFVYIRCFRGCILFIIPTNGLNVFKEAPASTWWDWERQEMALSLPDTQGIVGNWEHCGAPHHNPYNHVSPLPDTLGNHRVTIPVHLEFGWWTTALVVLWCCLPESTSVVIRSFLWELVFGSFDWQVPSLYLAPSCFFLLMCYAQQLVRKRCWAQASLLLTNVTFHDSWHVSECFNL